MLAKQSSIIFSKLDFHEWNWSFLNQNSCWAGQCAKLSATEQRRQWQQSSMRLAAAALQLSSRWGCGLYCEDVRSSSAAAQPRIGVWWYERRHVPCTTLPLCFSRRGRAHGGGSSSNTYGVEAPSTPPWQTLLRAYWALVKANFVLLRTTSVFFSLLRHCVCRGALVEPSSCTLLTVLGHRSRSWIFQHY